MEEARRLELAWAAGIIDGEGCIRLAKTVNRSRPSYSLIVKIDMTHEPTIRRLGQILGYSLSYYKGSSTKKQSWIVQWNGAEAYRVLKLLEPYLFTKKHEADLGIEYQEKCTGVFNGTGVPESIDMLREIIYKELKEAKL